jgi:hypothetical protein
MKLLLILGMIFIIILFTAWGIGLGALAQKEGAMKGFPKYVFSKLYNIYVLILAIILFVLFLGWANNYFIIPQ